jgi:Mg-chelatase subunit ChlD
MNPDLPFPDSNPDDALTPEARLEAQITALLLGELSPSDAARLRDRIESDPALRLLHDRLRIAIELTREVAQSQSSQNSAPPDSPRLDPTRRAQLLAAFRTPLEPVVALPQPPSTRTQRREWLAMAAMLVVLLGGGAGVVLMDSDTARSSATASMDRNGVSNFIDAKNSDAPPPAESSDWLDSSVRDKAVAESHPESVTRFAPFKEPDEKPTTLNYRFRNGTPTTPLSEDRIAKESDVTTTEFATQLTEPRLAQRYGLRQLQEGRSALGRAQPAMAGEPAKPASRGLITRLDSVNGPVPGTPPNPDGYGRTEAGFGIVPETDARWFGRELEEKAQGLTKNRFAMEKSETAATPPTVYFEFDSFSMTGVGGAGAGGIARGTVVPGAPTVPETSTPGQSQVRRLWSYNGILKTNTPVQLGLQLSRESEIREQLQDLPAVQQRELEPLSRARPVAALIPQPEVVTAEQPFSTFSLNVSDVSFQLAAASLGQGVLPDPASIRTEEFINAFNYHDPEPAGTAPVAFHWEHARDPFAQQRDLFRFSIRTAATGRSPGTPLNLVLLIDNSGSMERADRVAIRSECLRILAAQLQPADRISVVTFSRTARLWLDGLPGDQAGHLAERFGSLTPEGGTHLEGALDLAYQTASRHFSPDSINRVVLLTDGAANLGDVSPVTLRQRVEDNRRRGIALDCFGIGWDGLDDDLLEQLSRNGDGRYGFINSPGEATARFASQLAGALQVAASDVKVQVEFNPLRVLTHRQVGYARHQLTTEQFRDNTVDAAELAAAESGNALYVAQILPAGQGPIATVRVRFKIPATGEYREHAWTVPYNGPARSLDQSTPSLRLAAVAAGFAEWLSTSPHAGEVTPDALLRFLSGIPALQSPDPRPARLESMIQQANRLRQK